MIKSDSTSYYQQEALWGESLDASTREVCDAVLGMIPDGARSILDVGCGNGAITNHLPTDRYVEGCDVSPAALTHVRRRTRVASIEALPFQDGTFDLVLATDVLEHIPEHFYAQALDELARVSARWLLIAVPYKEILDAATVDCTSCGTPFHVHWHQRCYSADTVSRLWPERAGPVAHVFCGARWRWSSPLVVQLLQRINGRHYPFQHAQCPHCGAAHHPEQSDTAASIERRLEALHYALALGGRIPWPSHSEIVMLFDKDSSTKTYALLEEDDGPPSHLPAAIVREDIAVRPDPENYARELYLVPDASNSEAIFLPRLPASLHVTPFVPLAMYDPLAKEDVPLQPAADDWNDVPPVSASQFGYLLRIPSTQNPVISISFKGEIDPRLPESLVGSRHIAHEPTVQGLLRLTQELEDKRANGEERIEVLLRSCSELEAARDQAEHRVEELLKLAEVLEGKRAAGEECIEALLRANSEIETKRALTEERVEKLQRLLNAIEGNHTNTGEQIGTTPHSDAPRAEHK